MLFIAAVRLCGDTGTILLRQRTGDIQITLFGEPAPLRAGPIDLSVLVQDAASGEPVMNAEVILRLSLNGHRATVVAATHRNATNKLLYAAPVVLQEEGRCRIEVDLRSRGRSTLFETEIRVLSPEQSLVTYWPYLVLPAVAIVLFILNQWLKIRLRPARPAKLLIL
jgi:hypothetical protein